MLSHLRKISNILKVSREGGTLELSVLKVLIDSQITSLKLEMEILQELKKEDESYGKNQLG